MSFNPSLVRFLPAFLPPEITGKFLLATKHDLLELVEPLFADR